MWFGVIVCLGSWWACLGHSDYITSSPRNSQEACETFVFDLAQDFHGKFHYATGWYCYFDAYKPPKIK